MLVSLFRTPVIRSPFRIRGRATGWAPDARLQPYVDPNSQFYDEPTCFQAPPRRHGPGQGPCATGLRMETRHSLETVLNRGSGVNFFLKVYK